MSEMQEQDLALPQEIEVDTIFENPEGLSLTEIEKFAKDCNTDWEAASGQLIDNWEENAIIYKEFERKAKKGITGKVPEVWSQIQTEMPHLVNSVFSKSEVVRPYPKYVDIKGNTTKMKLYVNSSLLNASNARYKITDTIQNFLVYGTAIVKSYWNIGSEFEYDREAADWLEKVTGKPDFANVNIFDFAIDPTYYGHDPNLAPWLRERVYYTKAELKTMKQNGEIDNFEDQDLQASNNDKNNKEKGNYKDFSNKKNKIYVDEFWATMNWEEEVTDEFGETSKQQMTDEFFFWLLNGKKVIKVKKNWFKFKPYNVTRCYRISDAFWGQGDVDIMKAYAQQMSDIHLKAGILAKRVGGKLTMYTPASGFSKQDAKNMTDGLVMVDDLNQIKSENTTAGQDLQTLLAYKSSIKNDIQTATGINEILQGEPVGDQTATEASIMNQNSSARLTIKLQNIQSEILVPLARQYFQMSKQFIEEYVFNYKGEMVNLTPEDFEGDYDWVPVGSVSQSNKALQIKQKTELAMNLMQAAMQGQQAKAAGFDIMAFVKEEILPNFDIIDTDKFFPEMAVPTPMGMPPEAMGEPTSLPDQQGGMANPTSLSETIPTASDIEGNATNVMTDF